MTSTVKEVLLERGLAKETNKRLIMEALTLLEELATKRCTIASMMDPKDAWEILAEAYQSLSEL